MVKLHWVKTLPLFLVSTVQNHLRKTTTARDRFCRLYTRGSFPFSKSNSRTFQRLSRTILGIFKETTLTQNGSFISISKQVQSKFDILTVLT